MTPATSTPELKLTGRKAHVKISRELHKRLKVWCAYHSILMEDYAERILTEALDRQEADIARQSMPLSLPARRTCPDTLAVSRPRQRRNHS